MMKRTYIIITACCILLALSLPLVLVNVRERKQLDKRIQDVRVLTRTYHSATNVNGIEDLLALLAKDGIKLNNPIPIDPTKPSYRLVAPGDSPRSNILIEETNVTDQRLVVRSSLDGSVFVQSRAEQK